jgi:hypothetical protein
MTDPTIRCFFSRCGGEAAHFLYDMVLEVAFGYCNEHAEHAESDVSLHYDVIVPMSPDEVLVWTVMAS